jgi:hypothetical protein
MKWYEHIVNKLRVKYMTCTRDYYYIELDCESVSKTCKKVKQELEKKCEKKHRFQVITLSIQGHKDKSNKDFQHRNALIVDHKKKEFERFEPNGSMPYDSTIDGILDTDFRNDFGLEGYSYIKPLDFCPKIGPQQKLRGTKMISSCIIWSLWYIEQRLSNPEKERFKIVEEVIEGGKEYALKTVEDYIERMNELDIIVNVPLQLQVYKRNKSKM